MGVSTEQLRETMDREPLSMTGYQRHCRVRLWNRILRYLRRFNTTELGEIETDLLRRMGRPPENHQPTQPIDSPLPPIRDSRGRRRELRRVYAKLRRLDRAELAVVDLYLDRFLPPPPDSSPTGGPEDKDRQTIGDRALPIGRIRKGTHDGTT